jgi:hypothetical protein
MIQPMISPEEFDKMYRKHAWNEAIGSTTLALSSELDKDDVEEIIDVEYAPESPADSVKSSLDRQLMDEL